jgi:CBS-domain-containing membrane protein
MKVSTWDLIDKSFVKSPKIFIIQSLVAVIVLAIILYFVEILTHAAIIAALGASTFIVFAMPKSVVAQPKRLIGGHIVGLICGVVCYYALLNGAIGRLVSKWEFATMFVYAFAVGLSIFLMVITNTEHPPAAGTALGIVSNPVSPQICIFIIVAVVGLAIVRKLFYTKLKNLI